MNGLSSSTIPAKAWLFIAIVFYVVFWFVYPQEFIASDPAAYSARAYAISHGLNFGNSDVFSQRLGITIPVALFYSTLGINILTTNLWPLLAALLIIATVWTALPDNKSKLISALLCFTSIPLFESSVALYPDIVAAAFMAASSLILFHREKYAQNNKLRFLVPFAAVALLFMAFLAKESAYWVLPLWIYALSSDIRGKSNLVRHFHLPAILVGVLLGVLYLAFCNAIWNDSFARFHSVQALTGQHLWSWDKAPAGALLNRLTTAPVGLFVNQYGSLTLLAAILGFVFAPRTIKPWGHYAICCLLFFWFGTTSFTRYEPMPLVDRMTLPILPALYVMAALAISRLYPDAEHEKKILRFIPILIALFLATLPFAVYVKSWRGVELPEATAMSIIRNDIKRHPEKTYLLACSDTRSPNSLLFYFGYKYPENLRVVFTGDLTYELLNRDLSLIYVDRQRSAFLQAAYGRRNYDNEINSLGLDPVYRAGNVELLRAPKANVLMKLIAPEIPLENK